MHLNSGEFSYPTVGILWEPVTPRLETTAETAEGGVIRKKVAMWQCGNLTANRAAHHAEKLLHT